jgi:hypothetical protein
MSYEVLPKSRFAQIKEFLHTRFFDFVTLSLFVSLCALPAILWLVFTGYAALPPNHFLSVLFVRGPLVIGIMIIGVGMAGVFHYSERLLHGKGAVVGNDFIAGIRRHWRPFILIYFVIGVLYLLVHLNEALIYFGLGVSPEIQGVLLAINWFVFYLFVIAFGFMQTQIVLYKSSVWQLINNALRFTFGSLLKNALMAMLCFFPLMVFDWVPSPIAEWVSFGFAGFGYFALAPLFFTAYSYTLFDRYINKRAFPDLYRKGLDCDD